MQRAIDDENARPNLPAPLQLPVQQKYLKSPKYNTRTSSSDKIHRIAGFTFGVHLMIHEVESLHTHKWNGLVQRTSPSATIQWICSVTMLWSLRASTWIGVKRTRWQLAQPKASMSRASLWRSCDKIKQIIEINQCKKNTVIANRSM
jgi:hypothetical protein